MKITTFASKKTAGKFPLSPYEDDTFYFETREVPFEDMFTILSQQFTLNIPLIDSMRCKRRVTECKEHITNMLSYIVLDIDGLETQSNQALALKYLKGLGVGLVMGESRNPVNLKGFMKVNATIKEAKEILKKMNENVPGNVDLQRAIV